MEVDGRNIYKREISPVFSRASCSISQSLAASALHCENGQRQDSCVPRARAICPCLWGKAPPLLPQLNPIEPCFGLLKIWLQKHANLVFMHYPELVLDIAMRACTHRDPTACLGLFQHCGYLDTGIRNEVFENLLSIASS